MTDKIKPSEQFRVMLVYPNLFMMLVPSLAMAIFTKQLKDRGYQVDLFETTQYLDHEGSSPQNRVKLSQARQFDYEKDLGIDVRESDMFEDFRARVLEFKPDILLVSVVEDVFLQAVKLLEAVDDLQIPHLIGGVYVTAAGERCLQFPVIKRIAQGEGEAVIAEFAERVRTNRSLEDLPGTIWRDADDVIHRVPRADLIDINQCSPDFSLFEERRFYRPMGGRVFKTVPIETYRGCPYACTFCNSPMQRRDSKEANLGNFLRRKSIPNLRNEIAEVIEKQNPEFIYFVDDSFLARPRKEIFEFCDMYEEFKLPFWFNTRPENCSAEVLKRIKEVGCYRISFGIECGNEEYRRKVLLRYVANEEIIAHFDTIADSGIPFSTNLIIGFPGETRELIMDTVELVRSVRGYDTLTVSIFTPYHGTVLKDIAVRNGWLDSNVITKHTTSHSILNMPPPYLSSAEISSLAAVLPFYTYFAKSEWDRIRRAEIPDEEGLRIRRELSEFYSKNFLGETQDDQKFLIEGGTGCRSNPKDSFRLSPQRLSAADIQALTQSPA